ncbi:hypothetical protein ABLE91_18135 [Aquabacter sp. CN5-332]|uniref:hypothetical protein n=1 Tax=Aquabacter sp. CN5-332 TaxID=3156608 RepID=UPI0032B52169
MKRLFGALGESVHIAAAIVLSLAFVLILTTTLNHWKFASTYGEIAERRIALVGQRAHDSIDAALRLGLKLEDVATAQQIVANAKEEDRRVESVAVFSARSSRILHATDPTLVGTPVPEAWLSAQRQATGKSWHIGGEDLATVGMRLDTGDEKGVGGIALVYSLAETQRAMAHMRVAQIEEMLAIFALFVIIALVATMLATRDLHRPLKGLANMLQAGGSDGDPGGVLPESLRLPAAQFRAAAAEAAAALEAAERDLESEERQSPYLADAPP